MGCGWRVGGGGGGANETERPHPLPFVSHLVVRILVISSFACANYVTYSFCSVCYFLYIYIDIFFIRYGVDSGTISYEQFVDDFIALCTLEKIAIKEI